MEKTSKYYALTQAIFGVIIDNDNTNIIHSYEDEEETFEYVLSTLTEREAMALKLRFIDNLTLKEIGESIKPKVCSERARQIVKKALRKLRNPNRANYIKYGKHMYDEILSNRKELRKSDDNINRGILDTPIDEMNLSVRAFNCLSRRDINTLYDLTNITEEDLMNIRNMGRKTADEIISRMAEFGVCLKK